MSGPKANNKKAQSPNKVLSFSSAKEQDPVQRMEDSTPEETLHTANLIRIIAQLMRFCAQSSHWYGSTHFNAVARGLLFFLKKAKATSRVNEISL